MAEVLRVFVEKKDGFAVEAGHVFADLRETLGISGLSSLRLFNRYDVEGLSSQEFSEAVETILSEPNVDRVSDSVDTDPRCTFAVEYLPGQYDQRADSAAQCIALLTGGERPKVRTARVYALGGEITDAELQKIKDYLINPVEARLASMERYDSLDLDLDIPTKVPRVSGFISWGDSQVADYHAQNGFAMTVADLCFCRDYFKDSEHRDPTHTELKVIDTYWSDHCRHTTFLTELENVDIEEGELSQAIKNAWLDYVVARASVYGERRKPVTLMDMATIGTKVLKRRGMVDDLDESDEINACSINAEIEVGGEKQDWLIQFKNETHNHPTEIEPFGGAATCLGGAIRDPLSGRAYVYQAMRVTGSGDPTVPFEKTMNGKLPQKKITVGAAQGYSSYGNQIGLATGQVSEIYDSGYVAKRMEIGAVVGASPKKNVRREEPAPGDVIILLGGRTGRDGCGGATGSSKAHDTSSIETCGAEVQKGNPPTERKLQRLFRKEEAATLIKRCNDFGAGGVCVAIGELADGLDINLDLVPKKYEGLGGTELAISESQERMAVVVAAEDADKFCALAAEENLEATAVAEVTDNPRLVMHWNGDSIVDISREFLNTNGVTQKADAKIVSVKAADCYRCAVPSSLADKKNIDALGDNLARLEVCSQKGLSERFDSSIGAATVLMPFAGKYQLTPEEAMCAKVPVPGGDTDDATAMAFGFIPGISRWSPFHGSVYAVTQSLAKLSSIGAEPFKARLTFQEYFERLRDVPERWGKPAAALLGALTAQLNFGVPSIGGKDSMSGSFNELDVPPTLVSFALSMTKASQTGSAVFKKPGSRVYLVKLPVDSETLLPVWDKTTGLFRLVAELVRGKKLRAVSVVGEGGSAADVCKMCFGEGFGFKFADSLDKQTLFAPLAGSFVVETDDIDALSDFETVLLGEITDDAQFSIDGESVSANVLLNKWTSTLENVFPTNASVPENIEKIELYKQRSLAAPAIKTAKPRVVIPVFPGTNCELDTARAFEKAGAQTETIVICNLSPADVEHSIERFAKAVEQSQIIMIPGGFSGGDEPDGSGKFIATVLRNAKVRDSVNNLLKNRDGLMLGICNGFQALIKTGLVPYGEIVDTAPDAPTLTFNTIGRHVSQMAYTRVTSVKSPWMRFNEAGDIHAVPISHGEGRFVATAEDIRRLAANGQIATQYVDLSGNVAAEMPFNPNGSVCAIEGITSPDGRVLGKMAHSERKGDNLYKNVPFEKDQKIFEAGVEYFK